jgi:hypothetical protein
MSALGITHFGTNFSYFNVLGVRASSHLEVSVARAKCHDIAPVVVEPATPETDDNVIQRLP